MARQRASPPRCRSRIGTAGGGHVSLARNEPKTASEYASRLVALNPYEDGTIAGGVGNLRFTQSFLEALSEENLIAVGGDARYANSELARV